MSMKEEYTAIDMSTAAADGFRDGQRAALDHSEQSLGMVGALVTALDGLLSITQDSTGVAGYHLNGEIAEWGEFPEVITARDVISAYRATDKESLTAADSQASADDSRKLSDLGNELHNLSCHVVHVNEGWAEQIGKIACELWKWPQASAAQSAPAGERGTYEQWKADMQPYGFNGVDAFQAGAAWQRTQSAGVPEGKLLVSAEPLRRVLNALVNAPHQIRELQATREPVALFAGNPINILIAEYNAAHGGDE